MNRIHTLSHLILLFAFFMLSTMVLHGCSNGLKTAKELQTSISDRFNPAYSNQPESLESANTGNKNLQTVKVGILLPLSGTHAALGNSMLQAAQMAVFEMGYDNFELIPRDTTGTPAGAVAAAQSALENGSQIILGPVFADSVRAVKPIAAQRNINVIAFSTDWTSAGDNIFLMGFMPFSQVEQIASYSIKNGHKNFGVIAPIDKYGDAVTKAFEQAVAKNGGRINKQMRFISGTKDLSSQIESFAKNPAAIDAVFVPVEGDIALNISDILSLHGLTPDNTKRIGTGLWENELLAKKQTLSGALFASTSPELRQDFEKRYYNLYGQKPERIASIAYDATALSSVLARSGFTQVGRPLFDKTSLMSSSGFMGTDGVFRFKQNGIVERQLSILEYSQGEIKEIQPAQKQF